MGRTCTLWLVALVACGHGTKRSIQELQDPKTCAECHPRHYQEWSASMHAFASDDPVFVALNRRGQREAHLGPFCVRCHAPMAVALGLSDGTSFDPATLPPAARGVTCYFCHDIAEIADDHDNGLVLAFDDVMRGGVRDPDPSAAHHTQFDERMASSTNESRMCGSCHDVVMPNGVALERSYQEWKTTVFAGHDPARDLPLTCSGCHMKSEPEVATIAAVAAAKERRDAFHEHLWPAIDQATIPFPGTDALATGIARDLDPALTIVGATPLGGLIGGGGICVTPEAGGTLTVRIDTRGTGHMFPSGAGHDRRAWLEVIASDASDRVVFSTGVFAEDEDVDDRRDPQLFALWDRTLAADGTPAHFFWDVATVQSRLLRAPTTLDVNDPAFDHSSTATFAIGPTANQIDHVSARVRIRALPHALLRELAASHDLDPAIAARPPRTLDIAGSQRHWTRAEAERVTPYTGCISSPYN